MVNIKEGYVVQFNENHKWCGSLGIIEEVKPSKIMVGVPIPEQGVAYIFCHCEDIEVLCPAPLVISKEE